MKHKVILLVQLLLLPVECLVHRLPVQLLLAPGGAAAGERGSARGQEHQR